MYSFYQVINSNYGFLFFADTIEKHELLAFVKPMPIGTDENLLFLF
jgi:hypothetical protein